MSPTGLFYFYLANFTWRLMREYQTREDKKEYRVLRVTSEGGDLRIIFRQDSGSLMFRDN